ncbi:RDD family protein [Rhizobium sp. ICMP 5592]|uniref:RDD family protein n=1 Tax=Rhizobium sp. ICMP 5592 TaxID=2292445 RepID=UPI001296E355|nr:RDD family protein [Rhizobium sp. ICMP 5592]
MAKWLYGVGNGYLGPVEEDEIRALIHSGAVKGETLLWSPGADKWLRAQDVEEFASAFVRPELLPIPPSLPSAAAVSIAENFDLPTRARPWSRFWARLIDNIVVISVLAFAITLASRLYAPALYIKIIEINDTVWGICLLPLAALVLALTMGLTGTTPGKAILGIHVGVPKNQGRLKFFLFRELKVWLAGLGLGIPIVALFTQFYQYRQVAAGKPASYDHGRTEVVGTSSKFRIGVGTCLALALYCFVVYVQTEGLWANRNIYAARLWTNPVNNRSAPIARMWQAEELKTNSGRVFYFAANAQLAEALFGYEQLELDSISNLTYANAIKSTLASDISISSEWEPVLVYGYPALRAVGKSITDNDTNVEITVAVTRRHAWRTLVFARGRQVKDLPGKNEFVQAVFTTAD